MSRQLVAVVALCGGCDQWKAPDRVRELEGRVNELSAVVSAMAGKRVGARPGDPPEAPRPGADPATPDHDHAATDPAKGHDKDPSDKAPEPSPAGHDPAVDAKPVAHAAAPKHVAHWDYDGKEGPPAWATLDPAWASCDGKAQSPIDIEPRAGKASPITFHYQPSAATVIDNGHTLQVNLAPGSRIEIDDRTYELVQFHVHTPSEHTIAGEHYPLEVHLVHTGPGGKLAVIGVMFDTGPDGKTLDPVWSKWPKNQNVEDRLRKRFDPATLLPETRTLFRYTGSLTTPPCTEGVVWNVLRRTRSISKGQLDQLRAHYPSNARPTLPRGDRAVL